MSDEEVNILIQSIDITKLEDRDPQEVVGYFNTLDIISESFLDIEITENSLNISKTVSTATIVALIKKGDEHLGNIDDLLISEYDGTSSANTEMVANYKRSRELVTLAASHSGVHSLCKDSITGELLENIRMGIVELNKTTLSDIFGIAEIIKCKPGTYHIKFILAGYADYIIVLTIQNGGIIEMEALMVKLAAA